MELVNVTESLEGKFGPQVKDDKGNYYSFGKFFKGEKDLEPGAYEMDLFITAKGNRYINSLVKKEGTVEPKAKVATRKPKAEAQSSDSKVDWDGIARGKVKSLFVEALLSNPNVITDLQHPDIVGIQALVNELTDFVFEK